MLATLITFLLFSQYDLPLPYLIDVPSEVRQIYVLHLRIPGDRRRSLRCYHRLTPFHQRAWQFAQRWYSIATAVAIEKARVVSAINRKSSWCVADKTEYY